jgi:hypothetical protein
MLIGPLHSKGFEAGLVFGSAHVTSQINPLPERRIFPVDGEGKCAVQHNVSVSQ